MKGKIEAIKQILYVLLPLLVFVVLYDICAALLEYLGIMLLGSVNVAWLQNNAGTFRALCITGGLTLTFLCLLKLALADGFLTPKKEVWNIPVWKYIVVVAGTALVTYGLNYLFAMTGFATNSESYQNVAKNQYDVAVLVGLILYGVVSPFVEEVIFRGFLYGRMRVYMPKVWAVLISSMLFGVYHGNMVQGVYGFLMGLLFTMVYDRYKNFYLAVIMHAIANLVGYFVQLYGFI